MAVKRRRSERSPLASWIIKVDLVSDAGLAQRTFIQKEGKHEGEEGRAQAIECMARDFAAILAHLSHYLVSNTDAPIGDASRAFADEIKAMAGTE